MGASFVTCIIRSVTRDAIWIEPFVSPYGLDRRISEVPGSNPDLLWIRRLLSKRQEVFAGISLFGGLYGQKDSTHDSALISLTY